MVAKAAGKKKEITVAQTRRTFTTEAQIQAIIDSMPKACYRTIGAIFYNSDFVPRGLGNQAWVLLGQARPDCGYDCDGEENGVGCPVSGKCED